MAFLDWYYSLTISRSDKERRAHAQKKLRVHSPASPETQKLSEGDDSLVEVVETKRV